MAYFGIGSTFTEELLELVEALLLKPLIDEAAKPLVEIEEVGASVVEDEALLFSPPHEETPRTDAVRIRPNVFNLDIRMPPVF
jgi:hypothetical protein